MILRPTKWYQSLLSSKGRKAEGRFVVEGPRVIGQLLQSPWCTVEELLVTEKYAHFFKTSLPCRVVSDAQMQKMCEVQTPSGAFAVCLMPEETSSRDLSPCEKVLVLQDVQDPGNVGTLLRSAVAFGFSGVVLSDKCADPYAPKVVRSCGGALGFLWLERVANIDAYLQNKKENGAFVVVADLGGSSSLSLPQEKPIILVLGNEGNGVTPTIKALASLSYTIPYESRRMESLNVAVAGSIIMAQMYS